MKKRIPLKPNTVLRFQNYVKGQMEFVVTDVLGLGGSCIVYNGYYLNNINAKTTVRIKECYPYKLHLQREENNYLTVPENEMQKFSEYKNRIVNSFKIGNELHESSGLTNFTSNMYDIYDENGTVYIVSSYIEGSNLEEITLGELSSAIRVVLSVAKCIEKIHNRGYLYLDIKPENIFVFEETYDIVNLFDFDSVIPMNCKDEMTDYMLSYSMGFAPIEQKKGKLSQIGPYTDVYSLGALMFFLIFGKAPKPLDCGYDAEYDYGRMVFGSSHQNKVYRELTNFFRKTLQAYAPDRYQNMSDAVSQLELILKYADLPVPFICSTYVANIGSIIGRNEECNSLRNWVKSDENMLFVTGIGGIGKSTVVRKFISENKDDFDNVIYLKYKSSISDTIADDMQFCISGYEREEEESAKDYFYRKLKAAKELSDNNDTLLVIDDFNGEPDEELLELLKLGWKTILVTRSDLKYSGYPCLAVERLSDLSDLMHLFENAIGRKLEREELYRFRSIVDAVFGHTLILVLIARQISKSYITLEKAAELAEVNGFAGIAPEKVEYEQDGKRFHDKIAEIIRAIYDTSGLSSAEKKCLKICSMFSGVGISIEELRELLQLETFDIVNNLNELGWCDITDNVVQMHPLIRETINQIEWTDECRNIAVLKMETLFEQIKLNGKQEDYPKKLYERNRKIKKNMEQADLTNKIISKMLARKGVIGVVALERIKCENECTLDRRGFYHILEISKSVLDVVIHDKVLCAKKIYKDLLFVTLVNLPKDQEDYIVHKADALFSDNDCQNPYAIMELYDYVVYLLCQKEEYEQAQIYLTLANKFASVWKDHYVWGLFYDMQNDFYEALLNGEYCSQEEEKQNILGLLMESSDKSIKHMKKAKHGSAKLYYTKYVLGKAALLIRSVPEYSKEIKKLISSVIPVIEENALPYAEIRSILHMVCAWYYTLCEQNQEQMVSHLASAKEIDSHRKVSDLDRVDYYYIPAANMMSEIEEIAYSIRFLEEAYAICDSHRDSLPYMRKKLDLLYYQFEVFYYEQDIENSRRILHLIDEINSEAIEYGFTIEIPDEIRNEIIR